MYKFGGQPWFNDIINRHYKSHFSSAFGERKGKMLIQATAGRCVGMFSCANLLSPFFYLQFDRYRRGGQSSTPSLYPQSLTSLQVLLPLDVLKIKRQVNPEAFRGRGILRIIAEERGALYSGWGWTMARNAPGSFAVRWIHTPFTFTPFSYSHHSCSAPPLLPRNTSLVYLTTPRPPGHKTLSLPSLGL